ncbi:helix-turn-helix domain-containing protein [Epilithonimonas arachidiradicis]|uniref:Helix-turn-helix protein n=1 Tax=Epilithonimonas arachidiradicis TaxID=1617282 RepID=A0A420CPK1_9FLAO|nr:AraC family transcriptional regulator [Epilithonimonas arachidiradicis]RKE80308.1 helix-turn-helix protein [Epilithonimonas arachidiradicis]GGG64571.1 transcriptional regulator [Epilithonimonas arachidiradicis]
MKKSLYLFLILFSFYTVSYSQATRETQINIINSYDRIEIDDQEIASMDKVKQLADQSKKIGFHQGVLRGLTMLQKIALMKNDYIESGKYSDEAEVLAEKLKNNSALSAIYLYRGKINIILDKLPEAEMLLNKSLKYAYKIDNQADKHIQLCRIYANFAGMYEGKGDSKNWYISTKKSLNAIETTPASNLTEYQKSKYYYLYIFELMNMGNYYGYAVNPPRPELAEPYFKKMMAFEKSAPDYFKILELEAYESMSSFYLVKGDYEQSIDYAQKLLIIEKTKSNYRERLMAYRNIKDAFRLLKNDVKENQYLRLYTALNDSIILSEKKAIVSQSRDEIKKAYVKNEQSKKTLLWISGIVITVIAFGSWLLVRRKNRTLRNNYQLMIERLKVESKEAEDAANITNDIEDNAPIEPDMTDESEASNKNLISAETEARILRKLAAFEKSEKFLRKDLTVGLLSSQFNTNSKYLAEIIKNNKSQNFSNYINNLRINYIVHKLYNEPKYREYKISYLAEECGYASPQVFVLAFKKINGVTPSYFIQSLQEDESLQYN